MPTKANTSFYRFARLLTGKKVTPKVDHAAQTLGEKLRQLDVGSLPISDYNKKYFGKYVSDIRSALEHYTYLLALALGSHEFSPEEITLIDHGGGTGFLSLLARQAGVRTIIYNDIYDVSCHDARVIAETLALAADHYVHGDAADLLQFMRQARIHPHVIASFNVIEHIYDIEAFLDKLCTAFPSPLAIVMASSANTLNPRTRRLTMKLQVQSEREDRKPQWGHKERDNLQSFLQARKEIITKHFSDLRSDQIDLLAQRTRGLMEHDIVRRVEDYVKTKQLPQELTHPTNTCDPYTGNWAEHLMDPYALIERMERHSFRGKVMAGYYTRSKRWAKSLVTGGLNLFISQAGPLSLKVAPHYILYARNF
jgi:2-polyprenyl-3-methyl-5-hydroxy-6-metoxy-1,4-benzoquinol methylase